MQNDPNLKDIIHRIWLELQSAWSHLCIWRDIAIFCSEETDLANKWVGFFRSTSKAHLEAMIMTISRLLECPSRGGATVDYALNVALMNRKKCPGLKDQNLLVKLIRRDEMKLQQLRDTQFSEILEWRDQVIAHLDRKQVRAPKTYSVEIKESRRIIQELFTIISRYSALFCDTTLAFGTKREYDFGKVAIALKLGDEARIKMIEQASEAGKDKPHLDPFVSIPRPQEPPPEWNWDGRPLEPSIPPNV